MKVIQFDGQYTVPSPEALAVYTIEQIAAQIVPDGVEWEIIESENLPADPPPAPQPREVLRFDFRAALYTMGLLSTVNAAVSAAGGKTQLAWQDASSFFENDPTLLAFAAQLNVSLSAIFDQAEIERDARRSGAVSEATS